MKAILTDVLTIRDPDPYRAPLLRLATARKLGRLRPGESRVVRYWRQAADRIVLPRGLWPLVRRRWPMPVEDRRFVAPRVDFGWAGRLYPYQQAAVRAVLAQEGGTLVAMPGAGKTAMGLALVAQWAQPALWIVNTLELKRVALEQAHKFFRLPATAYGFIGDGEYRLGTHLTIGMVQTLCTHPTALRELAQRVGTVVVDESHHTPSETYTQILNRLPAKYRVGLSATPDRSDGLGPLMVAVLGPRVVVPRHVLVTQRRVMLPTVYQVASPFRTTQAHWAAMEKARAWHAGRNAVLVAVILAAVRRRRRILVLVERRDHAVLIAKMLLTHKVRARALISDVPATERNRWWDLVAAGRAVVVATRLANEGLDLQALDCLILGAAGRSAVRLEQQIGRVMRTAPDKATAEVWDLVDTMVPTYAKQARLRDAWYRAQGYRVISVSAHTILRKEALHGHHDPSTGAPSALFADPSRGLPLSDPARL